MRKKLVLLLAVLLILPAFSGSVLAADKNYDPLTVYYSGDTIEYNGIEYTAKWYTKGVLPGTAGSAWERVALKDADGNPIWYEGMLTNGGNTVSYNGKLYKANWWTTSQPGSDSSWAALDGSSSGTGSGGTEGGGTEGGGTGSGGSETGGGSGDSGSGTETGDISAWSAGSTYFQGDKVTYDGITWTAKYYTKGDTPGASDGPWEREAQLDSDGLEVWYEGKVYTAGERVNHNDVQWEAKWWTNTEPGSDSSWKNLTNPDEQPGGGTEGGGDSGSGGSTTVTGSKYSDATVSSDLTVKGTDTFRTVGYFPFYSADKADQIDYSSLTNIIYAFAFPDGNGGLQALDDVDLVKKLIANGHANGTQVQLGVGGWAYYGTIMEYQFDGCTSTTAMTDKFTDAIVALVDEYGFDGVDVDWEHPRYGTDSYKHYEEMMIMLRQKLGNDRLLTSAVLSGVTTDGTVYYDAEAHTPNVMAVCNWFNIMAYDCECTLQFDKNCADYWCTTRGMPTNKVVMGVPFYAYPSWTSYADLVASNPLAATDDMAGTYNYHNSPGTLAEKTRWAQDGGYGGLMIWEISQDTASSDLLHAISGAVK
ncbi:MAG: glycosyl hydrolase family 18 protein [Eubacteriaceae bacterium]|jgi:GH18 family chitinase/chitodextrinase